MAKCQEPSPIIAARPVSGIYFLLSGNEVVYVGKSKSILSRVHSHISERSKSFDSFTYLEFPTDELREREQAFYLKYKPIHNLVPPIPAPRKKYNKTQNTIACRKWRQKNKWTLKMRARERRAKDKAKKSGQQNSPTTSESASTKSPYDDDLPF